MDKENACNGVEECSDGTDERFCNGKRILAMLVLKGDIVPNLSDLN